MLRLVVAPRLNTRETPARGAPPFFSDLLALSAGLRNVLVHAYEEIDYEIVAMSIGRALDDLAKFFDVYSRRLDEPS